MSILLYMYMSQVYGHRGNPAERGEVTEPMVKRSEPWVFWTTVSIIYTKSPPGGCAERTLREGIEVLGEGCMATLTHSSGCALTMGCVTPPHSVGFFWNHGLSIVFVYILPWVFPGHMGFSPLRGVFRTHGIFSAPWGFPDTWDFLRSAGLSPLHAV